MSSNVYATDVGEVLDGKIRSADELQVVNPSRTTIPPLIEALDGADDPPTVRLLAARDPLKSVMDDFLVASSAADLVVDGALDIRVLEDVTESSILISGSAVTAIVFGDSRVAGLETTEAEFVEEAGARHDRQWEAAEEFTLRTPPLSRVRDTLEAEIGADPAADFDAMLGTFDSITGGDDEVDEVMIAILVAARNSELLYDISKWGEDVGLASKATFSRTKTRLEDLGVIDTEKVPIDVGRPRLRLTLSGEYEGTAAEDLPRRVEERLGE